MLILADELRWQEENHTSIKYAIAHSYDFHTGLKFNGNYSDVGFSILLSTNKVIWWYISEDNLKHNNKFETRVMWKRNRLKKIGL